MIYWKLFFTFFIIGAVSFGGGYGMISLIREIVIENKWLTESDFMNMIAVSESTPGPLAVNMATFVGSSQGGIFGSFMATLGVVLPSFFIILFIAAIMKNLLKYSGVNAFLSGIRPCVVSMILATALIMGMDKLLGFSTIGQKANPDMRSIFLFGMLIAIHILYKRIRRSNPSPIGMILLSAVFGIILYA